MSRHFNKNRPEDFGLIEKNGTVISPKDESIWISKELYDFGWGKENGYYKTPLPSFSELISIILEDNDEDDIYGSAAIILELYPKEFLLYLESIKILTKNIKDKFNKVFFLYKPINRTFNVQMSLEEIGIENNRWINISKKFQ